MSQADGPKDDAEALRNKGNACFKALNFAEAIELYSEALQLQPNDARLHSNRSAALYERGEYAACLEDVQHALDCEPAPTVELAKKLCSRAARACLWLGRWAEAQKYTEHPTTYPTRDTRELRANRAAWADVATASRVQTALSAAQEPQDTHATYLVDNVAYARKGRAWWPDEYFTAGHDDPRSLIAGKTDQNPALLKMHVPWTPPPGRDRVEVSVMLGGCGDARHLLMTLVDAAERCPDLSSVKLRLVANDHIRECLGRLLILLAMLDEVGPQVQQSRRDRGAPASRRPTRISVRRAASKAAKKKREPAAYTPEPSSAADQAAERSADQSAAPKGADAAAESSTILAGEPTTPRPSSQQTELQREEDCCFVFHSYFSNFLAPPLHNRLTTLLERLEAVDECPLSFVSCVGDTWAALRETLRDWRQCHLTPDVCMHLYREGSAILEGSESVVPDNVKEELKDRPRRRAQTRIDQLGTFIDGAPDEELEGLLAPLPEEMKAMIAEGPDRRDAIKHALSALLIMDEEGAMEEDGSAGGMQGIRVQDRKFFGAAYVDHEHYVRKLGRLPLPEALRAAYADAEDKANVSKWRPNPVLFPALPPYSQKTGAPLVEPFRGLRELLESDALDFSARVGPGGAEDWTLLDFSNSLFGRISAALQRLVAADALQISLDVGDTFALSRRVAQAQGQDPALPAAFDRVHINNVCDYEGMLPALVLVTPTLKAAPHAWLTHSILYAPMEYRDFDHYICASTMLPSVEHARNVLGARYMSAPPPNAPKTSNLDMGVWGPDACWISDLHDAPDLSKCTQGHLVRWLHDLAGQIVFPPLHDVHGQRPYMHAWPLSLAAFFALLDRLAQRFPQHWLDAALQPLGLMKEKLPTASVTTCRPQLAGNDTPRKVDTWAAPRYDTTHFAAAHDELRALATLWSRRVPALLALPDVPTVCCYEVLVFDQEQLVSLVSTTPLKTKARVLGLLLVPGHSNCEPPGPKRVKNPGGVLDIIAHGRCMPRYDAQLFSAVQWVLRRDAAGTPSRYARFWMLEGTFRTKAQWKGYAIGTDNWGVASKPFRVRDAVEVHRLPARTGAVY